MFLQEFFERLRHEAARRRSRPIWQALIAQPPAADNVRMLRFRLSHFRLEHGVWHKGIWCWDKPRWGGLI